MILVAFDRNHYRGFITRFLSSLRNAGNAEQVVAVTYGLARHDIVRLEQFGVHVVNQPNGELSPAIRRLTDFQVALRDVPDDTPVAHWDAADVVFQRKLSPLWRLVEENRHHNLVVTEPTRYGVCRSNTSWVNTIRRPRERQLAQRLLDQQPVVNGGFAAGTAGVFAESMRMMAELYPRFVSRNQGDQTVRNIFFRANRDLVKVISSDWNYCLRGSNMANARERQGVIVHRDTGEPIRVVHGIARRLEPFFRRHAVASHWV